MTEPHVHILMGTKNGGMFLADQLASIRGQSHQDWSLWASDDGSTDGTCEALENFKAETPHHDIHLLKGPQSGVAANYYKLLKNQELDGRWVAFSDQDDIWLPHKLSRAVALVGRLHAVGHRPLRNVSAQLLRQVRHAEAVRLSRVRCVRPDPVRRAELPQRAEPLEGLGARHGVEQRLERCLLYTSPSPRD